MSHVRHDKSNRRTAAAYDQEGSGCLSFYLFPPLSVLFFGIMIALILINIQPMKSPLKQATSLHQKDSLHCLHRRCNTGMQVFCVGALT